MRTAFTKETSGAVTVDWVVLTAGLVGLGLATMSVVSTGVQDTSDDVGNQLTSTVIYTTFAQRSHSRLYESVINWHGEADGDLQFDPDALFATMVTNFDAMSDAALVSSIQSMTAVDAQVEQHKTALLALDQATVTNAQVAAAIGWDEAGVENAVNTQTGGDTAEFLRRQLTAKEYSLALSAHRRDIADARGLIY